MVVEANQFELSGDEAANPHHVAIIMDGNGRWAAKKGLPRYEGHRRGVSAVRRAVRFAGRNGIKVLTLFSFSSENWSRPSDEIDYLFNLVRHFVGRDLNEMVENNVHMRVIGCRDRLPSDIVDLIEKAETATKENNGLELVVAFNYGGRDEIVRATRRLAERVKAGEIEPEAIDETLFNWELDTAGLPDPDLIIRTSAEYRISNFLLWQGAYSELTFPSVLWPDFDDHHFRAAIVEFLGRERRFGGV